MLMALAALLMFAPRADVAVSPLFSDNMVLQCDQANPVWGTAGPGETVTVSIGGQKKSATADKNGQWKVKLDPIKAGGPHELTIAGKNTLTLKNILVGEVWFASGQSNMAMSVAESYHSKAEIEAAKYPKIRLWTIGGSGWQECNPGTAGDFSAAAYFFGREIHKTLDVPVGLIHASRGGTPAQAFMSKKVFERHPELQEVPKDDVHGEGPSRSSLYEPWIATIQPYGIRGAIWYQGEANRENPELYRKILPALIKNWREDWGQGDFPFLIVQLANWKEQRANPPENWAIIREVQFETTLSAPKTGMAVAVDIGEGGNIHPGNKQDVGKRLALSALKVAYGKDVVYSGPVYKSMKVEGNKIRIHFDHVHGGLQAKGDALKGFTIASENKKFAAAEAKIDGDSVLVWSEQVAKPVAVRYGWADDPTVTLYNKEGLPAVPFRTDK